MKILVILLFVLNVSTSLYAIPNTKSNGVMIAVDEYLYKNADDYKSVEYIEIGYLLEHKSGLFSQKVKFRVKNKYGNYVLNEWYFTATHVNGDCNVVSIDEVISVRNLVDSGKLIIIAWYNPKTKARVENKDLQKL